MDQRKYEYFICFRGDAGKGGIIADKIYQTLDGVYDLPCFFSSAPEIVRCKDYREEERKALEEIDKFVVVLTVGFTNALKNPDDEVRYELITALNNPNVKLYAVAEFDFNWANEDLTTMSTVLGKENADRLQHIDYVKYFGGQKDYYDLTEKQLIKAIGLDGVTLELKRNRNASLISYLKSIIDSRKKHSGSYLLGQINKELFPSLGEMGSNIALGDDTDHAQSLYKLASTNRTNDYLMLGDGGIGKTVLLLTTCESFLGSGIPTLYVALHEIGDTPLSEWLFSDKSEYHKPFFDSPYCVLLLDGFNEVADSNKRSVLREIELFAGKTNVQVIMTSRFNPSQFDLSFFGFDVIKLEPLSRAQVSGYLNGCNLPVPKETATLDILSYPLMLTLYTNAQAYASTHGERDTLKWRDNPSDFGSIIWNYLQSQLQKTAFDNSDCNEILTYVFALEYVLPYIGYKMTEEECFDIPLDKLRRYLADATAFYKEKWQDCLPSRLDDLCWVLTGEQEINYDVKRIFQMLVNDLNLIIQSGKKRYGFFHQHFRDCLAGIHIINLTKDAETIPEVWKKYVDSAVIKLISELVERDDLDCALGLLRGVTLDLDDYSLDNIFQVYKALNGKNFNGFDFSGLDLRSLQLRDYELSKARFDRAYIDDITFCQQGHTDSICSVAFSNDGKYFASGSFDSQIIVWNTLNGTFVTTLLGHEDGVSGLAFDGDTLYSSGKDGTLRKWDITTSACDILYTGEPIVDIRLSNSFVYFIDSLGGVFRYDMENGETQDIKLTIGLSDKTVTSISLSYDRSTVALGLIDGYIYTLSENDLGGNGTYKVAENKITALTFPPDKNGYILFAHGGNIERLNTENGQVQPVGKHGSVIHSLTFKDEKEVISTSDDKTVKLFDYEIVGKVKEFVGHTRQVYCSAVTADGKFIVTGSDDNDIIVWNGKTGLTLKKIEGFTNWINGIAYAKTVDVMMTVSGDKTVRIWQKTDYSPVMTFSNHQGWVYCVDISDDGTIAVTGDTKGELIVWNPLERRVLRSYKEHIGEIKKVSLTPDGVLCASCDNKGRLAVWNTSTLETVAEFIVKNKVDGEYRLAKIYDVKISADGKTVVFADYCGYIYKGDIASKTITNTVKAHDNGIHALAVDKGFTRLATASNDPSVKLWDLSNLSILAKKTDYESGVRAVDFAPSNNFLVSATYDGYTVLCDGTTLNEVHRELTHDGEIRSARFLNDGTVLSGGKDSYLVVYDTETKKRTHKIKPVQKMYVCGCTFRSAKFTNEPLKNGVSQNGGIMN